MLEYEWIEMLMEGDELLVHNTLDMQSPIRVLSLAGEARRVLRPTLELFSARLPGERVSLPICCADDRVYLVEVIHEDQSGPISVLDQEGNNLQVLDIGGFAASKGHEGWQSVHACISNGRLVVAGAAEDEDDADEPGLWLQAFRVPPLPGA